MRSLLPCGESVSECSQPGPPGIVARSPAEALSEPEWDFSHPSESEADRGGSPRISGLSMWKLGGPDRPRRLSAGWAGGGGEAAF